MTALTLFLLLTGSVGISSAQKEFAVYIEVDKGCGSTYQAGEKLILSYMATYNAKVTIYDRTPVGTNVIVSDQPVQGGVWYRIIGVITPPMGEETFIIEAVSGQLTARAECGIYIGEEGPPTPSEKPYYEGQDLDSVEATLESAGVEVRRKGSRTEPGFNFDPDDPMLIGSLMPFQATLLFVASPTGTLRTVLTWDRSTVDLDLIVFGIGGTWCFQTAPAGILSELCDRPPAGPVFSPIGVFAVFIINWFSPTSQAYVLAWSS